MLTRSLIAVAVLIVAAQSSLTAEPPTQVWIRGTLDDLEICLRGEVVHADGRMAEDIVVRGGTNANGTPHSLDPVIDGNRFELWIPVNKLRWYSMWLQAASKDGSLLAYNLLSMHEIRQAAIDGVTLTLQRPERELKVKVTQQGKAVANAFVKTELGSGIELRKQTGADGTAVFRLLAAQQPSRITAWTEDFRVGGFSFNRSPPRDPDADLQEVELCDCRDQLLRFVDQQGTPVPDVPFVLQIATKPDYNFIGTNENSNLTTDAQGQVNYAWFPDWEQHYFYPQLQTNKWVRDGDPEMVDGVAVQKLRKSAARKRIVGRTVMQGASDNLGFLVTLRSFQGETKNQSDGLYTFSDTNGDFSLDVLPDATYCAWTLDTKWVGEVSHLIPYQSASGAVTSPTLVVKAGHPVKVFATSGASNKPYANLSIRFRREYQYSWQEDGRTHNGVSGPGWRVTTNAEGVATTYTLPGELKASVYTPLWRTEVGVDVVDSADPTVVRLHREVDEKRLVTGQLVLSEALQASLENAKVIIGAVDGDSNDRQEIVVKQDGSFSFETLATKIGIYASTADGKAAGAGVVETLDSPILLRLQPTSDYHGQLLGDAGKPLNGHKVWASVQLAGQVDYSRGAAFPMSFEAKRIETVTDSLGNYTLSGLPREVAIGIRTQAINDTDATRYLDKVYLQQGEQRPLAVNHLGETPLSAKPPLASRFEKMLRDCSLTGFRMLLIASADEASSTKFCSENFVNYQNNKDVYTFMQLVVAGSSESLPAADVAFLNKRNCPLPAEGRVCAIAIDSQGEELGRLELDIAEDGAAAKAANFVRAYAPQQLDAEAKWDAAFEEAKGSQRRVWARISQRYCGPCFQMARWIDDNQDVLSKDYVMLKIDNVRDANGETVANRLTRGEQHGVPFHAIFGVDQELLIDSEGPLGNIGHPSGFESKKHLRKMLLQTRQRLTDAEVDQIVGSLSD